MLAKVISLKNCIRRDTIGERLKRMPYSIFDAIDINHDEQKNIFDSKIATIVYGRKLMHSEIGCSISHFLVIKEFVNNNSDDEWLVIFEDDITAEPSLNIFLENIDTITLDKPTVLLLGHSHTRKNTIKLQKLKQPLHDKRDVNGVQFGVNDHINYCGAVAYAANRSAAELISSLNKVFWLSDDWEKIKNFGIEVLHPEIPLAYEDPCFESTIGNHQYNFHSLSHRPLFQLIKILISQFRHIMKYNDPQNTFLKFRP